MRKKHAQSTPHIGLNPTHSPFHLNGISSPIVGAGTLLDVSQPNLHKTARLGAFAIAAVWLAVAGVLYLVFDRIEQKRQASLKPYALSSGDLVIPRQRDGHFHVEGEVNRQPAGSPAWVASASLTLTWLAPVSTKKRTGWRLTSPST